MSKKIILLLLATLLIGVSTAAAQERAHTVQRGENLTQIARLYGVSVQSIITRNGLANPNRIVPGQVLIIPSTAPQPAPTPLPPAAVATYIVQRGDTLNTIAARFGLSSWRQIGAFNDLQTPNLIFAGQVLRIPPASYVPPASYQPDLSAGQGGGALPPQQTVTYIVRQGDTLDSIARAFNTTQAAIIQANNLVTTIVIPGQVLLVPLNTLVPPPPAVTPPPPVVLPAPPVNTTPILGPRYVVQPGDTMIQIARRANRSPWAIAAANGIYNLNRIFVGQVLIIP